MNRLVVRWMKRGRLGPAPPGRALVSITLPTMIVTMIVGTVGMDHDYRSRGHYVGVGAVIGGRSHDTPGE